MTNYLANFLPELSVVSAPLRELTRKENDFCWSDIHHRAFDCIKVLVSGPLLLKYYEPDKPLVLQCDCPGQRLLVIVFSSRTRTTSLTADYFSDLYEVNCVYRTTSEAVIKKLKGHIARYGIQDEITAHSSPLKSFVSSLKHIGSSISCTSPH